VNLVAMDFLVWMVHLVIVVQQDLQVHPVLVDTL
jgi:hypothetical protein